MIYILSLFIWDINIEGNYSITDETILEYLESQNVEHGMRKANVDSDRIVNDLRQQYDDIIWVSAYVTGTRLMIQVRESTDTFPADQEQPEGPTDIVADRAGMIVSIITRRGIPMVRPGDTVEVGDVLVSGRVEIKNDSAEVIAYQYQVSDADIYIQTEISYQDEMSLTCYEKEYSGNQKRAVYLKLANYIFSLGSLNHSYEDYEQSSFERQLRIGQNFFLPISYGVRTVREYTPNEKKYREEEIRSILTENFERYSAELEKRGVVILENDVKIYTDDKTATAKGVIIAIEPAGKQVSTEIIEIELEEEEEDPN